MAILSNGTDISTLFKARTSTKIADVGILDGGTDISNDYEPIGATTKIANVGILSGGSDISNLFMDINASTAPAVAFAGAASSVVLTSATGYAGVVLRDDGNIYRKQTANYIGSQPGEVDIGDWVSGGNLGGTPGTAYEWRVGERTGSNTPSLRFNAVTPPTGTNTFTAWQEMTGGAEWYFINGSPRNCQFTLEIRIDGGTAQSTTVTLNITN